MNIELLNKVAYNIALLLVVGVIFISININRFNKFNQNKILFKIISGIVIGIIGILIMINPFELIPGLVFDMRTVLISITGLFFGFIPTIFVVIITSIYRIIQGGLGTVTGIATIIVSALIGLTWRYFRFRKIIIIKRRFIEIYVFGLIVHIGMLLCMFFLPLTTAIETLKNITLPILLIYPFVVTLISLILFKQYDKEKMLVDLEKSEKNLKESVENNQKLFSNLLDAFAIFEAIYDKENKIIDYKIIKSNKIYKATFGEEIILCQSICKNKNSICFKKYEIVLKTGIAEVFKTYCKQTKKHFDISVYLVGKNKLAIIQQDITKQIDANIEAEKLKALFDSSMLGNIVTKLNGEIVYINEYFASAHGYTAKEVIGKNYSIFHTKKQLETVYSLINVLEKKGYFNIKEVGHIHKNGYEFPMLMTGVIIEDENGNPINMASTARDITEQKNQEKERRKLDLYLNQQQRLESIGTLAGGVAHEINNPINGIMNYGQLILEMSKPKSKTEEYVKEIIFETKRVSNIVKNLLQFSRDEKQEHSYARIEDIIEQTLSLIRTIIKSEQITLEVQLPKGYPDIKCRSQQIQQVIMNMLTNARDAVNEKYQGYNENKIVKLYCTQFDFENRRWIRVTVEDHGNGINDEIKAKIFEPFFTTKNRAEGTGLGLSISHGIVKEHHGKLSYETKEGEFTKFNLDLPVDNGWDHDPI